MGLLKHYVAIQIGLGLLKYYVTIQIFNNIQNLSRTRGRRYKFGNGNFWIGLYWYLEKPYSNGNITIWFILFFNIWFLRNPKLCSEKAHCAVRALSKMTKWNHFSLMLKWALCKYLTFRHLKLRQKTQLYSSNSCLNEGYFLEYYFHSISLHSKG